MKNTNKTLKVLVALLLIIIAVLVISLIMKNPRHHDQEVHAWAEIMTSPPTGLCGYGYEIFIESNQAATVELETVYTRCTLGGNYTVAATATRDVDVIQVQPGTYSSGKIIGAANGTGEPQVSVKILD